MSSLFNSIRWLPSRGLSWRCLSSKQSVSLKKLVLPLIKKIHPDACVNESAEIQKANLICLQTLNELSDKLASVETGVLNKTSTVSVLKPLTAAYALSFYCSGESEGPLKRHAVVLSIPQEFTSAQNVSLQKGRKALRNLYVGLLGVLRTAGVEHSTTIDDESTGVHEKKDDMSAYAGNINISEKTLEDFDFDRKMFDRVTNIVTTGGNSSSLFTIPDRKNQKIPRAVIASVDKFIYNGNVLVKELSPDEEIKAISRLREFLVDYSLLLNFHPGSWRKVFFILCQSRKKFVRRSELGGEYLLIPSNFKHRALLEFLRVNLSLIRAQMSDPEASAGLNKEDIEGMEIF